MSIMTMGGAQDRYQRHAFGAYGGLFAADSKSD